MKTAFWLCVIIFGGGMVLGDGGSAAEKAGAVAKAKPAGFGVVDGRVTGAVPAKAWEAWLKKLARAKDRKAFNAISFDCPGKGKPIAGVRVVLVGCGLERETVTDEEGRFVFDNISDGNYRVFAELEFSDAGTPEERLIEVSRDVLVRNRRSAAVELNENLLTVRGWVRDSNGRTLPGVRVFGRTAPEYDGPRGETAEMERWIHKRYGTQEVSGVTDEQGRFELTGLKAAGLRGVLNYLVNANPKRNGYSCFLDVRVAPTDSAVQLKPRRVPLVSERILSLARGIIEAQEEFAQRTGAEVYTEKEELPYGLPMVDGNAIEGVEIVLTVE